MKRPLALALVALATVAVTPTTAALATTARTSLTDVEDEVMCVACHTPLAVSESPQADSERDFIRSLIARGETKAQIKQALVSQYGDAVLALPKAHGFNLTVYILPPAILIAGLVTLAIALPRWRRRTRAVAAGESQSAPTLTPAEARRLEQDLASFE